MTREIMQCSKIGNPENEGIKVKKKKITAKYT